MLKALPARLRGDPVHVQRVGGALPRLRLQEPRPDLALRRGRRLRSGRRRRERRPGRPQPAHVGRPRDPAVRVSGPVENQSNTAG